MAGMRRVRAALKLYGAKGGTGMAGWLVDRFPPRDRYIGFLDGCFGTGAVTMAHDPDGKAEVAVDADARLMTFWRALRDRREELLARLAFTPFGEPAYEEAVRVLAAGTGDDVEVAAAVYIVSRQSLAGRNDGFTLVSTSRVRRAMLEQTSAWNSALETLPAIADRFARVLLLAGRYQDHAATYDKKGWFHYVDFPYLAETRASKKVYREEMTPEDHAGALALARGLKHALVMISGNPSKLYDEALKGWRTDRVEIANSSAGGKTKETRVEKVWLNYTADGGRL